MVTIYNDKQRYFVGKCSDAKCVSFKSFINIKSEEAKERKEKIGERHS